MLIYTVLIFLLLLVPRTIVIALSIVESVSRILKNTISFFVEQVNEEAFTQNKVKRYGKVSNEKPIKDS